MILGAIAAAAFIQAGALADGDSGRVAFTLVDPASGYAVAFDRAEPRYALVRLDPAGAERSQAMPLDRPSVFARLQSTTVVSRPPGRYAIIDVTAEPDPFAITPGASDVLTRFDAPPGGWISVTCAADGPARCTSSREEMMSAFR